MNKLQMWLMRRYCPDFESKMPADEPGRYRCSAIIIWGYWGHNWKVVASKEVDGLLNAYLTARWLALKAQFRRPTWFFYDCGINYGIKKL